MSATFAAGDGSSSCSACSPSAGMLVVDRLSNERSTIEADVERWIEVA